MLDSLMMLCMLAIELMTALSAPSAPPAPDVVNNTSDSGLDKCDVTNDESGSHRSLTLLFSMKVMTDGLIRVCVCVCVCAIAYIR